MVLWGAYVVTYGALSPLETVGFVISVGLCSGAIGINVAHELAHRVNHPFEPLLARIMLCTVGYMHWAIEHVAGHHRNVATPPDPATARLGESFYAFWPRTVFGGYLSAWHIESQRLRRQGRMVFSLRHRIIQYTLLQLMWLVALMLIFNTAVVLYCLAQSLVAISLLEIVNYMQHYGLLRHKIDETRYEPVQPHHSWNSCHRLTNYFLFNLQRHSDHHYRPQRRYQILRHYDTTPQFGTGYGGMVLLAAIPFLWRRMMDPQVRQIRSLQSENIQ